MKIKLRDLTKEQYRKLLGVNCDDCNTCPFRKVYCNIYSEDCWINNKDIYSDKFLNQEIEIDEE